MRRSFDTMGVTATLVANDTDRADAAVQLIREVAARCTRFDESSELMRLNRARELTVSPLLFDVARTAMAAQAWTGGRFDPTLGDALVRLGYDRTFDDLDPASTTALPTTSRARTVLLDHEQRHIRLLGDAVLDLGGIAKGFAADRACELLGADGLVDIGGDIACTARTSGPWMLDVEHLLDDGDAIHLQVTVDAGGIATSGTTHRRWAGGTRHHVLDPATGTSAATDWSNVTVVASSCARAEVVATALLLTPRDVLERAARTYGVVAFATDHAGHTVTVGTS